MKLLIVIVVVQVQDPKIDSEDVDHCHSHRQWQCSTGSEIACLFTVSMELVVQR